MAERSVSALTGSKPTENFKLAPAAALVFRKDRRLIVIGSPPLR
jgi:hypothetical protein